MRWLNLDTEKIEVEWQVLGHSLTACALRLNNTDARDKRFVPTFIIASDGDLQIDPSLLVPAHHFQSQNKVIIWMGNEQKSLILQRFLLRAKEFSQYEFTMP